LRALGRCSVIPEVLPQGVEALLSDAHFC